MMKVFKHGVLLLPAAMAIAAAPVHAQEPMMEESTMAEQMVSYACNEGRTFQATYMDNMAQVMLEGEEVLMLPQIVSASGARYSDGETTLFTSGNEAFIEIGGDRRYDECVAQIADTAESAVETEAEAETDTVTESAATSGSTTTETTVVEESTTVVEEQTVEQEVVPAPVTRPAPAPAPVTRPAPAPAPEPIPALW